MDKTILYKPKLIILMMFKLNIYYVSPVERTKNGKKGIWLPTISNSSNYIVEFESF